MNSQLYISKLNFCGNLRNPNTLLKIKLIKQKNKILKTFDVRHSLHRSAESQLCKKNDIP